MAVYDIAAISTDTNGSLGAVWGGTETLGSTVNFGTFIHNTITSAGWTPIATATQNGRLNIEYIGVQPGYFDPDNIPSWYGTGDNIPWVQVLAGPSASTMNFKAGIYNGTAGTSTTTTNFTMSFISSGNRVTVWANPHQILCRRLNSSNVHGTDGFLISAMHIPDFAWEGSQIKALIFACRGITLNQQLFGQNLSANCWSYYHSNLSTAAETSQGNGNLTVNVVQQHIGARAFSAGEKYIWNPVVDSAMNTATSGHAMICPAIVAWDTGTFAGGSTNTSVTANGMLWDCVFVNRRYTFGSTISRLPSTPTDRRLEWICLATSDADSTRQPGSLIFVTGTST